MAGLTLPLHPAMLMEHFGQFGEIDEVPVMRERGSRVPRGFAFVVFKEEVAEEAAAAALEAAPHIIDGRVVDVKKALPRDKQGRLLPESVSTGERERPSKEDPGEASAAEKARAPHKIFIGGLPSNCTELDLIEYFSDFGEIKDSVVMYDPMSKRSRGFGFIAFSTEEALDGVFNLGSRQEICGKVVEIKRAVPKVSSGSSPTQSTSSRGAAGRRTRGKLRGRGQDADGGPFSPSEDRSGAVAGYLPEGGSLQPYGVPLAMGPQDLMAAGMYPPVPGMYGLGGLPAIPVGYQPAPYGQWPVPPFIPGGVPPELAGVPPLGVPPGMIPAGGPPYMVPPMAAVGGVILATGMPVSPSAVPETKVEAVPDTCLAEPQKAGQPQPTAEPAAANPAVAPAPLVEQMGACKIQETEASVASGVKA